MSSPAPRATNAPLVVYRESGVVVGEIGPVSVAIWRGEVTRARFEQQRIGLAEVARRHKPNAAFLCLVEETATAPGAELRKASADMMTTHANELSCSAMVIEGAGFKASMHRSVLTGMALLVRERRFPFDFCATVLQAALWMSKYTQLPAASFVRDVETLRAAFRGI